MAIKMNETIFERAKYFAKSETDKRIEELKTKSGRS